MAKGSQKRQTYELRGHQFERLKCSQGSIAFCDNCGHVPLHNPISALVTKLGCNYKDHVSYQRWERNHSVTV